MVSSKHTVTTTEKRTYALNNHLEKQLSPQHAQNQVKRCQVERTALRASKLCSPEKGGDALGVGTTAAGYQGNRNGEKKKKEESVAIEKMESFAITREEKTLQISCCCCCSVGCPLSS